MNAVREHEAHVADRFDELSARFKPSLPTSDFRLAALVSALGPLTGRRLLDLGCGKGRFARALQERGAEVVGLDVSRAMLREARGLDRVLASARRLPFRSETFDAVLAVEVIQHLPEAGLDNVASEVRRVLRSGGLFVIIDRNLGALDPKRPWVPSALLKMLDERRGRWMYEANGPVRERWHWPRGLARRLGLTFSSVLVDHLRAPDETHRLFELVPRARRFALWRAIAGGPTP